MVVYPNRIELNKTTHIQANKTSRVDFYHSKYLRALEMETLLTWLLPQSARMPDGEQVIAKVLHPYEILTYCPQSLPCHQLAIEKKISL